MSPAEVALWRELRNKPDGLHFRKQHPAGEYSLDFYCARAALAIEVDGAHHDRGDRPARDAARDAWLAARGIETLRIPARDVFTNLEGVLTLICATASARLPPSVTRLKPRATSPANAVEEQVRPSAPPPR